MTMFKKTFLIFVFLFITSCGYEAMHSIKNLSKYDFSIESINLSGDRDVNLAIEQRINNYKLDKKSRQFTLNINTSSTKETLAKNTAGDPTSFENTTSIDVQVYMADDLKGTFKIEKKFKYNNISNKFDLDNYEQSLKQNLAETITNELLFKLSNFR